MNGKMKFVIAGVLALLCAGEAMAGTLKDSRDGKKYPTVKIGKQTWMAENLNYKMDNSCCNPENNCGDGYGRLYTWEAALMACPSGWHLPSKRDIERLLASVYDDDKKKMSRYLREDIGWGSNPGNNSSGFSALPAGNYGSNGWSFDYLGIVAYFWSSTEYDNISAYSLLIGGVSAYVDDYDYKYYGSSVRCLQDSN